MEMALKMSSIAYLITHNIRRGCLRERLSIVSFIHLSLLTCPERDAPVQGRLDGSVHTRRDAPTTSRAISLPHGVRGIQLAKGILQWISVVGDFEDDRGSGILVAIIEGALSARIIIAS
jgi:hypothetical protein